MNDLPEAEIVEIDEPIAAHQERNDETRGGQQGPLEEGHVSESSVPERNLPVSQNENAGKRLYNC